MELTSLYEYYGHQAIAPTFADLRDDAAVRAYEMRRATLLAGRLAIPLPLLRGAEILEYGPDTGENAIAFARLGARMTLVEPAYAAHAQIRAYFDAYAPPGALSDLVAADVLSYVPERARYDMVVAEGFIYTVQPSARWLETFALALMPGGLVLLSYYERTSALFELLLKVPFAALRRRERIDRVKVAQRLYRPKWDRIPHTRAFESWVMDVLDNPFVRLRYFIDAAAFAGEAAATGFSLHSGWPSYLDGLENAWSKRLPTEGETLARSQRHIGRSILTFVLGTKAYLFDAGEAQRLSALLDVALTETDALIDADDPAASRRLAATLREFADAARTARTLFDSAAAVADGIACIRSWADVIAALGAGEFESAVQRLREDRLLLDGWGTPSHLAVLRAGAVT